MATKLHSLGYNPDDVHRLLTKRFRRFYASVVAVVALPILLVILKLVDVQIIHATYYREKASATRNQSLTVYRRGRILDSHGRILAQDITLYDVYAHPRYYYDTSPEALAKSLQPILRKPLPILEDTLKQHYDTIRLAHNLDKDRASAILKLGLPGIDVPKKMVRRYPQGHLASHIIGYVNDDAHIATGIERAAIEQLQSSPDIPRIERSPDGQLIHVDKLSTELVTDIPQADDVQLTIDSRIQYIAEDALEKGLERTRALRGTAIVLNPTNGEVLAFAVKPDFHPEQYRNATPMALKNWAITDVYPPGSTFKILTVACGLESGVINRDSTIVDTGQMKISGHSIQNYDYASHGAPGNIDLVYLLQHSSNIGSLKISLMMDPAEHYDLLKKLGIGSRTNIELPGESSGIIHPPKYWDRATHANIGFGYGIASTPLQVAAAVSAIANKGIWVTPHVMRANHQVVRRRVMTEHTAETVKELLATSIANQKTSIVNLKGLHVAGKTGTSRKPREDGRGYSSDLFTSFVGFFPANNPQVLVMVVVDSPRMGNAWGSTVAGPIFKDIGLQTASYLGIKPDESIDIVAAKTNP